MPMIPAAELVAGHFMREGSSFLRIHGSAFIAGEVQVSTNVGTRRYAVDHEVFVASATPRAMATIPTPSAVS